MMDRRFKLADSNNTVFFSNQDETIFEAALKSGITISHSCLSGRCNSCKIKVIQGNSKLKFDEIGLAAKDVKKGEILSCARIPQSDMILEFDNLIDYDLPKSKILPAKISLINRVSEEVIKIKIRFPPGQTIDYIPGQFVSLIKGDIKRSYSIANAPSPDGQLEFFIKNYPDGKMSNYLFQNARVNDLLFVEGPKGTFFLRDKETIEHMIFLATGTGIAPIKAILESLERMENRNFYTSIFWGLRKQKDIFWGMEERQVDKFEFNLVLSRENKKLYEHGYVQNVVLERGINLENVAVYACGSQQMIHNAQNLLSANGLRQERFYSDVFTSTL